MTKCPREGGPLLLASRSGQVELSWLWGEKEEYLVQFIYICVRDDEMSIITTKKTFYLLNSLWSTVLLSK